MTTGNSMHIHERFLTFQGEGVHAGSKAFFIRTMGCPVKCSWCDSAGTWHPDWKPKGDTLYSIKYLISEAVAADPLMVVLTGGEPMIQPHLQELALGLRKAGLPVHVETCGAFYQNTNSFDWITISPKIAHLPDKHMLHSASELKLIIDAPNALDYWIEKLTVIAGSDILSTGIPVWLHPEWGKRQDPEILKLITQAVTSGNKFFRAGWQMHKLYNADALDGRAKATVPLGGVTNKGSAI